MDIDQELNKLLFKYNIDEPFPNYREFVKAYDVFMDLYGNLQKEKKHIVFVSENYTDLKWVQNCICLKEEEMLNVDVATLSHLSIVPETLYINVSYCYSNEILLVLREKGASVISIYNVFEQNDIYFQNVFYDIYGEEYLSFQGHERKQNWENFDINLFFFQHRRLFELEEDPVQKEFYFKKLVFDCVYAKDFVTLKSYLDKYDGAEKSRYQAFYTELLNLFGEIKEKLSTHKDEVLMIWLDALEYGEDADMTYLKGLDESAVTFSNAYTVTPYTGPTFKTLFAGKRTVEEESFRLNMISEEESELFRELEGIGYEIQYYGIIKMLQKKNKANYFVSHYTVLSQLYWYMLRDVILAKDTEKKIFVLHELLHTHIPFVSFGISGSEYWGKQAWPGQQQSVITQKKQAEESRHYVDQQLRFYGELFPSSIKKIYLSDHGHTTMGRFHALLKFQSDNMKPRNISNLFSYVDFGKLLLTVVKNEDIDEEKLQAEYVLIQDVDYYNPVYIEALLERCDFHPEEMFGYQGVVTQTDMLIKHNNGTRFYQKHHNDGVMVTDERMSYLESLISKKQINVWEEDKFEASRKIYAAWNKSNARCKVEEEKKLQIIMNIFKGIKDGTTLAIRGGGIHTLRMLMVLPYELRQKVSYIIDCDKNCVAGKLGVCVISPDELEDYAIDTIILSSFDFRGAWKESLKSFSGALMDVYDAFEEQGIYCTRDFYRRTFCPEDFIEED